MSGPPKSSESPLRVCFTAFHAYPLFDPTDSTCVGGLETHAWLLANGLASQTNCDVQFVVQAPVRFRRRRIGHVEVWNRGDGWDAVRSEVANSLRFEGRHPKVIRWSPRLLWQLPLLTLLRPFRNPPPGPTEPDPFYSRIHPDVSCCFGVSAESAGVVATAREAGRPSILFLESNSNLDERFTAESTFVSPYGERGDVCWFAIQHATQIVAQQTVQQRLLKERFGRDCVVLPNLIDLETWDQQATGDSPLVERLAEQRFVLWVGRADDFHKRPRLCLELARRLDTIRFVMILNPFDKDVEREVREQAPANVTIVESIPFGDMPALLRRAELLVSTGSAEFEGAPNIFLQAAASRTPVASLDVPLPTPVDAGLMADGDLNRLAKYISEVWDNPERSHQQGLRGREAVEQGHALPVVIGRLRELLSETVTRSTVGRIVNPSE